MFRCPRFVHHPTARLYCTFDPTRYFDILLQDVGTEQLKSFSKRMGVEEFSLVQPGEIRFPAKGIIVGSSTHRLFISLAVAYEDKTIWVPFLVDSGCPWNFMSARTMNALGVTPPRGTTFTIHGFDDCLVNVSPSKSHFADVNIIGGDFFHHTSVLMLPVYHKRSLYFFKNEEQLLKELSSHL